MSTILAFVPRISDKPSRPIEHPPTIIIFPGVRYERLETPAAQLFPMELEPMHPVACPAP